MSDQPRLTPTFRGFINDTTDALILFSACLDGIISHVPRRPHDRERQQLIVSGSVFIYEEHASGIKRWTDGISWSPSRILDNFLIYRELQRPFPPGEKKRALKRRRAGHGIHKPVANSSGGTQDIERSLVGSLTDSYDFKGDGLVKKTISINYRGVPHHLVSYYDLEEVKFLPTPSTFRQFANVRIRPELYLNQNFRTPVPGMPLILHQHLEDPNDPNAAAAAAAAHGLYLPVSAADVTPPAPTITPEQVVFTQALADMAATAAVVDSVYTTADWVPAMFVTADAPAHAQGEGHNHHQQQYQMQQHAQLQHHHGHSYPQLQQQQLMDMQQQQQFHQQHQHLLHPSPIQPQHQLLPSPVPHPHQNQHPSPVQNQQHQRRSAMQYQHSQSQEPQHLFQQAQQRHHEQRNALQPAMLQHGHGGLSLGGNPQNTTSTSQYEPAAEEWVTWFPGAL
ncbi:hypothetical protein MKX07_005952 [Trichoderma sp. CBMAI-0711]|uniref:Gti1/Pac2 family protein n=1 Tax=Trichoderma parareesei TaxID=858221 RepID=A0A2H2ZG76_TRIPA|nr:hypothetical protein MKX07_005952 [Trichoderma sp. CBMAI-0711]OTA04798.1 hypothetical protein A9Z42_0053940 [Trichoderma parareesei]